MVFQNLL